MADSPLPRATRRVRAVALGSALALVLGVVGLAGAAPAQAAARPSASAKAWVSKNSYGKFVLAWKRATHATRYKVIVATDPSMKRVVFTKLTSGRSAWVSGAKIKEGTKYYYRVRSYNGSRAGGATVVRAVRPRVKPVKKPENLVVRPAGTSAVFVDWSAAYLASGYTVKLRSTKTGTPFWSRRTTATSMTVTGTSRRAFFVTVTADRVRRTFRDSETVFAATSQSTPSGGSAFTAKVGSYNVMHYNVHQSDRPWASRRAKAASYIRDLDIVGIQESTWGTVPVSALAGTTRPIAQLAALADLKLAVNPATSKPCSLRSVHLLYRPSRFSMSSCGEKALQYDNRFMTWAVLKETNSNTRILAVNTHLMNGSASNPQRATQTRQIISTIRALNPSGLPVVITGDLNSFHGRATTTPMSLLISAGYYPADLVAPARVNVQYASAHDFRPTPKNAYRIDHVYTSGKVKTTRFDVRRWSTESSAPSDHHPVVATVAVYR